MWCRVALQLSAGQVELSRASGQQVDWFQQQRALQEAQHRAASGEQTLARVWSQSLHSQLLARAQVARLRCLVAPSSATDTQPRSSWGGKGTGSLSTPLALLDLARGGDEAATSGVTTVFHPLRHEAHLFEVEAVVSSALFGSIQLYRALQGQLLHFDQSEAKGNIGVALCTAASSAVRGIALGWQVVGLLASGSSLKAEDKEEWLRAVVALFRGLGSVVDAQLERCQTGLGAESEQAGEEDQTKLTQGAQLLLEQVKAGEAKMALLPGQGKVEDEGTGEGDGDKVQDQDQKQRMFQRSVKATTQLLDFALSVKLQLYLQRQHQRQVVAAAEVSEAQQQLDKGAAASLLPELQALDASLTRCASKPVVRPMSSDLLSYHDTTVHLP